MRAEGRTTGTTRFVGRDAEMATLPAVLAGERLVSLVGAPGCGKTRLAVELGRHVASDFAGGVRFVDLARVSDPESVVAAVAADLDVSEEWGRPMRDVLLEALAGAEPVLVVLDNCEHVVDVAAAMAADMVAGCPPVSVLATSRVPLGAPGERVCNVPRLDLASAVALFVDRAEALPDGPPLDLSDAPVVETICARLDCLPLAVELTAAWSRVLAPEQILGRLTDGAGELAAPARGNRPRRYDTMAAAVEGSYQLLSAEAQRVFRRVSVFAGGFEVEALDAVAGSATAGDEVLDRLTELVDHSLVTTERAASGPVRYRMLEPVRQHGRSRLDRSGEGDEVRRRHYDHYLDLAARYEPWRRDIARPVRLERLVEEESDLLAALAWARRQPADLGLRMAAAASLYFTHGGRVNDGLRWLEEGRAQGTDDRHLLAKTVREIGHLAWLHGDYRRAHACLEEALALAHTSDDAPQVAWALRLLSVVELSAGETAASVDHAQQALDIYEAAHDQHGVASALTSRAWTRYVLADADGGDADMRAALEANRPIGNATVAAFGHFGLAYGAGVRGDTEPQRAHLVAALAAIDDGGVVERADWLAIGAVLAAHEGRYHAALQLLGGKEAWEHRRGGTRSPAGLTAPFQDLFERVFQQLAGKVATRLWNQGLRMSWDALVTRALDPERDRSLLTSRENEVAELVAEGLTNVDIARRLVLSRRTVESHVDHIRQKLGLGGRHEIIVWVLQAGR